MTVPFWHRFWPDRIAARIAVTVLAALTTTQIISFVIFSSLPPPPFILFKVSWLEAQLAALTAPDGLSAAASDEDRFGDGWLRLATVDVSSIPRHGTERWPYADLAQRLAGKLGPRVSRVVITASPPRFTVGRQPSGPTVVPAADGAAGSRPELAADLPIPGNFAMYLVLADGTGLRIAPVRERSPLEPLLHAALWLISVGCMVAALSIWAGRRLTVPIEHLKRAASDFGVNPAATPAPEAGPHELRVIARTMNEMRERLRRFVRDRTMLVAAISHDLRTPLTRLRLRVEFLPESDLQQELMHDITQMEAMISETLQFAADDARQEAARPTDLGALIESVCADLSDTGREVTCRVEGGAVLNCQAIALRRALTNLVDNAVTHGQRADVSFRRSGNSAVIRIEDQGPGVPDSEFENVFTPFYRLERSRSRETGGAGLGLAVARNIVRGHGGDITLANAIRRGLIVTVTLPLADRRIGGERPAASTPAPAVATGTHAENMRA